MRKYASETKLNGLETVMIWHYLWWNQSAVKGQSHKNTAAVTWRFSSRIPRLSNPYLSQELSSTIVWETYFWQLDLQAWSLRKKSFTSFLTLINVCSPLGQNAQRWVPVVIWSIVQISQSKCCHIVGKRTNGANVQESHEKLLWNNAQGWEVLTHVSQEAKCLNKAW